MVMLSGSSASVRSPLTTHLPVTPRASNAPPKPRPVRAAPGLWVSFRMLVPKSKPPASTDTIRSEQAISPFSQAWSNLDFKVVKMESSIAIVVVVFFNVFITK